MILTGSHVIGFRSIDDVSKVTDMNALTIDRNHRAPLSRFGVSEYALIARRIAFVFRAVALVLLMCCYTQVRSAAIQTVKIAVVNVYFWISDTENEPMQQYISTFATQMRRRVFFAMNVPLILIYTIKIVIIDPRYFALRQLNSLYLCILLIMGLQHIIAQIIASHQPSTPSSGGVGDEHPNLRAVSGGSHHNAQEYQPCQN